MYSGRSTLKTRPLVHLKTTPVVHFSNFSKKCENTSTMLELKYKMYYFQIFFINCNLIRSFFTSISGWFTPTNFSYQIEKILIYVISHYEKTLQSLLKKKDYNLLYATLNWYLTPLLDKKLGTGRIPPLKCPSQHIHEHVSLIVFGLLQHILK